MFALGEGGVFWVGFFVGGGGFFVFFCCFLNNIGSHSDVYRPVSFKPGLTIESNQILHVHISLDDLDLLSR